MSIVVSGVRWSAIGVAILAVIQFAQLLILARYLSPIEMGNIAVLIVISTFANVLSDGGFANAIIQNKHVTKIMLSSLFWMSIFIGLILCIAMQLLANDFARFFNITDELFLKVFSLIFLFGGGSQLMVAYFRKELRFSFVVKVEVLSTFFGFVVLLILVFFNQGIWAYIFSVVMKFVLTFMLMINGFRKQQDGEWRVNFRSISEVLKFGVYQLGERLVDKLSGSMDRIVIAPILGAQALGQYHLAKELLSRPLGMLHSAVSRVSFPMYSAKHNILDRENAYIESMKLLLVVTMPFLIIVATYGDFFVVTLLGEKWGAASTFVFLLAIIAIVKETVTLGGQMILAEGRADINFHVNIVWSLLLFVTIYMSVGNGVDKMLEAMCVFYLISTPIWLVLVSKYGKVSIVKYIKGISTVFLPSVILLLIAGYIKSLGSEIYSLSLILNIGSSLCLLVVYILAIYFLDKPVVNRLKSFVRKN